MGRGLSYLEELDDIIGSCVDSIQTESLQMELESYLAANLSGTTPLQRVQVHYSGICICKEFVKIVCKHDLEAVVELDNITLRKHDVECPCHRFTSTRRRNGKQAFTERIHTLLITIILPCLRSTYFAEAKLTKFLYIFQKFPGESYTPSSNSSGCAYDNVKKYNMGMDFEHIDISEKVNFPAPLMLSVRKNPLDVVKSMFGSKEGRAVLSPGVTFDSDGQRVFSDMWTADKWLNDQVHSNTSSLQ